MGELSGQPCGGLGEGFVLGAVFVIVVDGETEGEAAFEKGCDGAVSGSSE